MHLACYRELKNQTSESFQREVTHVLENDLFYSDYKANTHLKEENKVTSVSRYWSELHVEDILGQRSI